MTFYADQSLGSLSVIFESRVCICSRKYNSSRCLCQLEVNSVKLSSLFRTNERPCNKFRFKIDFLDLFTVVLMLQSHEIENYAHPDIRLFKLSPKT